MTERSAAERVFDAFRVLNHELAITANTDGYFTWTSAGVSELLGWSQEELCSCKFIEYVHPDDVERTLAVAGEVRPDGSSVARFENRYRCRDGSYRWIEWRAVTIGDETRCLVQDISARKAAEQRAEERLEWLKMAERLAGVGHWRLRLADKHLEWSDEV
ncbi:MAG: PAS domain-containing protein, partial [Myxococcota bacterium]